MKIIAKSENLDLRNYARILAMSLTQHLKVYGTTKRSHRSGFVVDQKALDVLKDKIELIKQLNSKHWMLWWSQTLLGNFFEMLATGKVPSRNDLSDDYSDDLNEFLQAMNLKDFQDEIPELKEIDLSNSDTVLEVIFKFLPDGVIHPFAVNLSF